jgi:hypothetical protein
MEEGAEGAEQILTEAAQQNHFRGTSRTPRGGRTGPN